jgi:hypothetical protein
MKIINGIKTNNVTILIEKDNDSDIRAITLNGLVVTKEELKELVYGINKLFPYIEK